MKVFLCLLSLMLFSAPLLAENDYNHFVLEAISEMPRAGGYELTARPVKKMRDAFSWNGEGIDELNLNPDLAKPSYCTTATYMVFYKLLQKYWLQTSSRPSRLTLERLKPNLERDGLRVWGRWNSNGPGAAKLIHDIEMGISFDDIDLAQPGDFLKIFWNNEVGKKEKGHTVIYLGRVNQDGQEWIKFWGSSTSTQGFGTKLIPRKDAIHTLFTRITRPENFERLSTMEEDDPYLASMLTKISSWAELKSVTGIE